MVDTYKDQKHIFCLPYYNIESVYSLINFCKEDCFQCSIEFITCNEREAFGYVELCALEYNIQLSECLRETIELIFRK